MEPYVYPYIGPCLILMVGGPYRGLPAMSCTHVEWHSRAAESRRLTKTCSNEGSLATPRNPASRVVAKLVMHQPGLPKLFFFERLFSPCPVATRNTLWVSRHQGSQMLREALGITHYTRSMVLIPCAGCRQTRTPKARTKLYSCLAALAW